MLDVPPSDPRHGKAQTCACRTETIKRQRYAKLRETCRVPAGNKDDSLDLFGEQYSTYITELIDKARSRRIFLLVHGNYGTGKTTLGCATVNEGITQDLGAIYLTMGDLLEHLRRTYSPDSPIKTDHLWDAIVDADILVLDELDRFNPTPWAEDKFFTLTDHRYRRSEGLTIFITNKQWGEGVAILEDSPGYLESRLREKGNQVLQLGGDDRRQKPIPQLSLL